MGNRNGAFIVGTAAAAALLLGACGTPPPGPDSTTTTSVDDTRCRTDKKTIETAIEAYAISQVGVNYPATLDEVLDAGFLRPDTDLSIWTYTTTGTEFSLTGPC